LPLYDDSISGGGRVLGYNLFANASDYTTYISSGMILSTSRWETVRMTFDAFGRQISQSHTYLLGSTVETTDTWTSSYDIQGHLLSESSPTGFINYEYDDLGRKTKTQSGTTGTVVLSEVTYSYNSLGQLRTVNTTTRNGVAVDSNATVAGDQPETTTHFYDMLGRMDYTELPNAIVEDYTFDTMDRLDVMRHFQSDANNANLTDNVLKDMFDYSYSADGKRTGLNEKFGHMLPLPEAGRGEKAWL
jgi:YD repeat-containing protein